MNNIMLIGIGPHAKKIYINFIKKYHLNLSLLVELNINKDSIKKYLKENNFFNTKTYFIDKDESNLLELSDNVQKDLKKLIKENKITNTIISTEPKSHFAYAKFMIKNNINVLMDKPITSPINVLNNTLSSKNVLKEYNI